MRKVFVRLCLLCLLLCLAPLARAETSGDITKQCSVTDDRGRAVIKATDRRPKSAHRELTAYYTVKMPEKSPVCHIYVQLHGEPQPLAIQAPGAQGWVTVAQSGFAFAHQYFAVKSLTVFRIVRADGGMVGPVISELFVYGPGEVPGEVQRWETPSGKMDMMLIVAHPDDELIWFGGTIPFYAGQLSKKLLNVYMTCGADYRRTELLNGLWHCGQSIYPIIGRFRDARVKTLDECNAKWGAKRVHETITAWLREWRPDVVLTHSAWGEYGHGAHRATADGVLRAVKAAGQSDSFGQSVEAFGVWEVKKLYLHLGGEQNRILMDWRRPLDAFEGATAYEVAVEALSFHQSQDTWKIANEKSRFSSARFDLVHTTVGADVRRDDFFEHIELDGSLAMMAE